MAKLYAELSSDKGGRVASKGGNDFISINLYDGNSKVLVIEYCKESNSLSIDDDTENMQIAINGILNS